MLAVPRAESALLITCPQSEHVVGSHRAQYDRAAQLGVPAHITVIYPFQAPDRMTEADHVRLQHIFTSLSGFMLVGASTAWFNQAVLYVEPQDPSPIIELAEAVVDAFPDFPPYGGAFEQLIPHLTVGHDQPVDVLRAAERDDLTKLPFSQKVTTVELWSGPPLSSGIGRWVRARSYRLGP